MSKTILTNEPCIEMVSHNPHTNLSLGNFGGKFCYLRKKIDNYIVH